MNKRKKKRIEKIVEDIMWKRALANLNDKKDKNTKLAKGRINWYDIAIKEVYKMVLRIIPNKGMGGSDIERWVEATLPDDIQDYLENQEIDFQLSKEQERE